MNDTGRARGRRFQLCFPPVLAGVLALALVPSLYGGGRQDAANQRSGNKRSGVIQEETAGTDLQFDEAIRLLSTYPEEDSATVTENEKRLWAIVLSREGYNTLPQDMQDVLTGSPDDSAKVLDLIERLELLGPVLEVDGEVLAQVRDMAIFGFKRRQLDQVMARGRVLLGRGDYVAALGCYADGLDIYQEEFFDLGYGRDINAPVRESLAALMEGIASFPRLLSSFKGVITGINSIGVTGDAAVLARLREYHARLLPLIEQLITLNTALAEAGNTFDAQMARIRAAESGVGDRSFLVFASRLIRGPRGGNAGEGMLGVIDRLWTSIRSPFDPILAANTERAYQNAASSAQFESVIAYSVLGMRCLDDWRRFYQGQDVQTYRYFDDTVLAPKAEEYLQYVSYIFASESLRDADPLVEQYNRLVSMNAAAQEAWQRGTQSARDTLAREEELRRSCRALTRIVEPVQEGLRVNAETLKRYRSALTGMALLYPPMEQALSRFNRMDIFTLESRSAVRVYTLGNRDLGRQVAEWQTRLTEANRLNAGSGASDDDAAREAADALDRLLRISQEIPRALAEGQALVARYDEEPPRMAGELAGLSREARSLVQDLETVRTQAGAREASARALIREIEDRRAIALAQELERLRLEAEAQKELARNKEMADEERRARELALAVESLQAKSQAEELAQLHAEAQVQEQLARNKALAEEETRARSIAEELAELHASAQAQELEKLRVEAAAQEQLAREKALTEEQGRAQILGRELEESRVKALARELEENRAKVLARELTELQAAIRARQALTPALIAQAETLKQEGDRFMQEARSALAQSNFERARDRVLRAGERYDAALAIQETADTRKARDTDLVALGAEINRLENQTVVREVRPLVTQAREAYEAGTLEVAEQTLVRALSLWRRTNVEDDSELTYWLTVVRGALSLRAGRVIPVTAPLYAEMSQLLSDAKKLYDDGAALLRGGKRAEGLAKFDEARRKTREVKLVFPVNEDANLLELRIDQVTNPDAFNADFQRRLSEAVAGAKKKDVSSFAKLQNLAEINPGYPGIQGMVVQAEIDLGYRPPPPDNRALTRAAELVASARAIIDRNDRTRFPAALAQLNQALVLNPANSQASALKDRLQTSPGGGSGGGGAPLVLSSAAEREYQRAVRELQQGNTLVAMTIVQELLQDPRNRTTRLQDLQRRIQSYL